MAGIEKIQARNVEYTNTSKNNAKGRTVQQQAEQPKSTEKLTGDSASFIDLLGLYESIVADHNKQAETVEPDGAKEASGAAAGGKAGKAQGKSKQGKKIPPGIAKKSADQLPAGNPWKAVLESREAEAAAVQKAEADKRIKTGVAAIMTQLLSILQELIDEVGIAPAEEAKEAEEQPLEGEEVGNGPTVPSS